MVDNRLLAPSRHDPVSFNTQPCCEAALPVAGATPRTFGKKMETVIIKSTRGARALKFSNRNGDYFDAELSGDSIFAKKGIWGYTDTDLLISLFESIAGDWKGWEGERHWAAIEGDLDITATSDKLGHIRIDVVLLNNNIEDDWKVEAPIYLDAGCLDSLCTQIRRFFTQPK